MMWYLFSLIKIREDKDFLVNQRESMIGVMLGSDSYQIQHHHEKQRSFMLLNQQKQRESSDLCALNTHADDANIITSDDNINIIYLGDNMDTVQTDDSDKNGI